MSSGKGSLAGRRVVVTRAAHQAAGLCESFRAVGALVEPLPLLEIRATTPAELREVGELGRFDWLAFTSANGVEAFLPAFESFPPSLRLAAVGGATAEALERRGLSVDLKPEAQQAEGLLAALAPRLAGGSRVLLPQAEDARPVLVEGLRAVGATIETLVAYRKSLPEEAPRRAHQLFDHAPLGWVTFTSPRIVRSFVGLFGESWNRRRASLQAASIGPVTSSALAAHGVTPAAQAAQPSDQELVAAVVATVGATRLAGPG